MIRLVAGHCRAAPVRKEAPEWGLTRTDLRPILEYAYDNKLTVHKIQDVVADFYGLRSATMRLKDSHAGARERRLVRPRQVAMFFARELTKQTLPDIGKRFGGRDHTTVIHAIKSVAKRSVEDPYLEIELEALRERLCA